MATHSSIVAWKTPWTEESGRLESMGCQRVGKDLANNSDNSNNKNNVLLLLSLLLLLLY